MSSDQSMNFKSDENLFYEGSHTDDGKWFYKLYSVYRFGSGGYDSTKEESLVLCGCSNNNSYK